MTANLTITDTELQAIRSAERYLFTIAHEDAFRPSQSVQADLATVNRMLSRLATAPPIEEVAEEPPEDSPGPSVVDRGSDEIDARWAKETIGLVAVELNQAYAEFEFTRNDGSIPSGRLQKAHRMLLEAMLRLGVSSVYCNNDNPF